MCGGSFGHAGVVPRSIGLRSIRSLCLWGSILGLSAALGPSSPAAAEVAPLNGDLTFARTGDILRIGTEAIFGDADPALVESGLAARDPAWSPDALRIAFAGRRAGNLDIWVISSDGDQGRRRLTKQRAADTEPDWSPGGEEIAFTSRRDGNSEIYVMESTGAGQRRLAASPGTDREPMWSPDGKKIAFASDRGGSFEIWVMNANGTDAVALTQEVGPATDPAWSPDGSRIAYASGARDATSILSVDSQGADRQPITSGAKGDRFPAWSPDGLQVAFSRGSEVMVAGARGPGPRRGLATMALTAEQPRSVTRGSNPDWGVLPSARTAPPPEAGETANAFPGDKGEVTVQVPGALGSAPLESSRQLPVDTRVDTTAGQLTLVAPAGEGETTKAVASQGRFTYTQTDTDGEDPENLLELPLPSGCASGNSASRSSVAASRPNTVDLSVKGLAEGAGRARAARRKRRSSGWRVKGANLSGSSGATEWTTTIECDRSIVAVRDGVVEVQDTTTGTKLEVPAGHCYVAPSPVPFLRQDCE